MQTKSDKIIDNIAFKIKLFFFILPILFIIILIGAIAVYFTENNDKSIHTIDDIIRLNVHGIVKIKQPLGHNVFKIIIYENNQDKVINTEYIDTMTGIFIEHGDSIICNNGDENIKIVRNGIVYMKRKRR